MLVWVGRVKVRGGAYAGGDVLGISAADERRSQREDECGTHCDVVVSLGARCLFCVSFVSLLSLFV